MVIAVQRTIAELATLYKLEPLLRDVFVEGADDVTLIQWYLKNRVARSVSVVEVQSIEVPTSLVEKYELENGNRGRLLTLAFELEALLPTQSQQCFTAVYDKDRDSISGPTDAPENALPTDFSCLEMYLFDSNTIGKFVALVLMTPNFNASQAIDELGRVLVRLWAIKTANHLLRFEMSWISFHKLCSFDGGLIQFDETEFVKRYLMNNGRSDDAEQFSAKIEEILGVLTENPRNHIDGHHFYSLARLYLKHHAREDAALREKRAFERAITGCVELAALDSATLFQGLVARVG